MSNLINITNQNGNLVVSSREVAKHFEKRHSHVVEAIENKIQNLTTEKSGVKISELFIDSEYEHKGNFYKEYLLTRDGFSFIVMGFTGSKADIWKLKYIEAFNKMEQKIKQQIIPGELSPQLQLLINMELKQRELETAVTETKEEVQAIREVIEIRPSENWRKETNLIVNKICIKLKDWQKPRDEIYKALEERARCNLKIRLNNLRGRAFENCWTQSKINALNYLDVIADDNKLIEIYTAIVKEMAIKHKIA